MVPSLVFRRRSKNWFSFPPLINAVKIAFPDISIKLSKNYLDPDLLSAHSDYFIFCDSFQSPSVPQIKKEINYVRFSLAQQKIKAYFIAGGPHASGDPEGTLEMGFDIAVRGEGELILPKLITSLSGHPEGKIFATLSKIEGICFKDESNNIIQTLPTKKVNLDQYLPYSSNPRLHPPIEITRGCPFGCTYCQVSFLFGRKPRHRSLEQISKIVSHYFKIFSGQRQVDIRFITPNAFGYGAKGTKPDFSKVEQLIKTLKMNFPDIRLFLGSFPSEIRPEFISEDSYSLLSELDNENIAIGAQSGSNRILELIHRGHTCTDVIRAVELINESKKTAIVDFILGLPYETRKEQFVSLEFAKSLIAKKARTRFHHFLPLPGTPLANTRPTSIDPKILLEIGELTRKGQNLGSFDLQRKLSAC
ncbi:MAG: TIGR04013 family B12-binding domain/radical SAM domain-containing protein [Candidatus Hodarchaeota archaeon]